MKWKKTIRKNAKGRKKSEILSYLFYTIFEQIIRTADFSNFLLQSIVFRIFWGKLFDFYRKKTGVINSFLGFVAVKPEAESYTKRIVW